MASSIAPTLAKTRVDHCQAIGRNDQKNVHHSSDTRYTCSVQRRSISLAPAFLAEFYLAPWETIRSQIARMLKPSDTSTRHPEA